MSSAFFDTGMKSKVAAYSLDDNPSEIKEGQDADFGLAVWQLDALWKKLQLRMSKRIAAEDDEEVDLADTDFGLSEEQVDVVMEKKVVREVLTDDEAESDANDSDFGISTGQIDSFSQPGSFAVDGESRARSRPWSWHVAGGEPACKFKHSVSFPATQAREVRLQARVALLSTRDIDGVKWYLLEACDGTITRYFAKRYSDFLRLDTALRRSAQRGGLVRHFPELPNKIPLAIFQALLIDGFEKRREDGLRRYAECVVSQVASFEDEPALRDFIGSTAIGSVQRKEPVRQGMR